MITLFSNYRPAILALLIGTSIFSIASNSMAKPINLYEQPQANSKVSGAINSDTGIITIFTPKESGWIKVADPTNGNVGWIKTADVKNNQGFSFNVTTTGNGTQGYQVIQYGSTQAYTPEQIQQAIKQMRTRQQTLQKEMQHMMDDMFTMHYAFPMIMPIVVVPETNNPQHTSGAANHAQSKEKLSSKPENIR